MWNSAFVIFIGGGVGSVLRFLISSYITKKFETTLPIGTLVVNVLGSLILGLLAGYFVKHNLGDSKYSLILTLGFCGGFTTFSTFAYENALFLKNGDCLPTLSYAMLSIV